jgi:hypothetical protein
VRGRIGVGLIASRSGRCLVAVPAEGRPGPRMRRARLLAGLPGVSVAGTTRQYRGAIACSAACAGPRLNSAARQGRHVRRRNQRREGALECAATPRR